MKWSGVQVHDSEGRDIKASLEGKAFAFVPKAGERYVVEAVR